MRITLVALALLAACAFPVAALADPINPVIGSAGGFSGSGTLITTSNGDGSYTITGITGTGVTGLIAPGGFNSNDNQLFPSGSTIVDGSGFSFGDNQGNTSFQVNLFSNAGSYFIYLVDSDAFTETIPVDFSVQQTEDIEPEVTPFFHPLNDTPDIPATQDFTFNFQTPSPTPEPSSLILLGTGLLAAAGLARRRKLKA
jgi:hypothetical protein